MNKLKDPQALELTDDQETQCWEFMQKCLLKLAEERPAGDDTVYDYWRAGLGVVGLVHSMFSGDYDLSEVIESYAVSHMDDATGLGSEFVELLNEFGITVEYPDQETRDECVYGVSKYSLDPGCDEIDMTDKLSTE